MYELTINIITRKNENINPPLSVVPGQQTACLSDLSSSWRFLSSWCHHITFWNSTDNFFCKWFFHIRIMFKYCFDLLCSNGCDRSCIWGRCRITSCTALFGIWRIVCIFNNRDARLCSNCFPKPQGSLEASYKLNLTFMGCFITSIIVILTIISDFKILPSMLCVLPLCALKVGYKLLWNLQSILGQSTIDLLLSEYSTDEQSIQFQCRVQDICMTNSKTSFESLQFAVDPHFWCKSKIIGYGVHWVF